MFSSSGYFKGINCPYYGSGLCERAYCHFRHVKSDPLPLAQVSTAISGQTIVSVQLPNPETLHYADENNSSVSAPASISGHGMSLLGMMGSAIKQVQRDTDKFQPTDYGSDRTSVPSYRPTPINQIRTRPLAQRKPIPSKSAYLPAHVPAYQPTPIHVLEKQKHTQYRSSLVYDPLVADVSELGSSGPQRLTLGEAEKQLEVCKNNIPEPVKVKQECQSTSELEIEAKFSSDEECDNVEKPGPDVPDNCNDSALVESQTLSSQSEDKVEENKIEINEVVIKKEKVDLGYESDRNHAATDLKEGIKIEQKPNNIENSVAEKDKESRQTDNKKAESIPNENESVNIVENTEKNDKENNQDPKSDQHIEKKPSSDTSKHRHRSRSPNKKHHHSSRSRHKKDNKKHKESSRSSRKHKYRDQDKKRKHKKSDKSRSHSKQRHKDTHKHRKSDRHKDPQDEKDGDRHQNRHSKKLDRNDDSKHRRRHSSKSSSSKHRRRYSSDSASYDSDSSSDSYSSSSSRSPSPANSKHEKRNSNLVSTLNKDDLESKDSVISMESQEDLVKSDVRKSQCLAKAGGVNLFEKFDRSLSHVDLFGDDSSDDDGDIATIVDVPADVADVILLSDDVLSEDESQTVAVNQSKETSDAKQNMKRKSEQLNQHGESEAKIPKISCPSPKQEVVELSGVPKKRTAHVANPDAMIKRPGPKQAPLRTSAAQQMLNRYKIIQAEREKQASSNSSTSAKQVAHLPKGTGTKAGQSLLKKSAATLKAKLDTEPTITNSNEQTISGTQMKGTHRIAHTPSQAVLKKPIIPSVSGGKVATKIRQRYLNMFVDECIKIYPLASDAQNRALLEERTVYERASSKNIYLNFAVNTIKKLRDEISITSESSDQEPSPTKNPAAKSHLATLGGAKAAKTLFTVSRKKKLPEHLTDRQLYILMARYIMTEEQLVENNFPRMTGTPGQAKIQLPDRIKNLHIVPNSTAKYCVRCGKQFTVLPDGKYVQQDSCEYHWGKNWKKRIAGSLEQRFTCCQGDADVKGCQISSHHVYEMNKYEDLEGYVQTMPCTPPVDGDYKIYAMDCEMIYTTGGCELARVTVIDTNLQPVYESSVKPEFPVIDYNTRFSGLTAESMEGVTTTIHDVQQDLMEMFNDKTILLGHSLESDLISLKLLHSTVVDTSVVFPHKLGLPYKRALKTLMAEILQKIIQNNEVGHDSREDAAACMELMIWKVKDDAKKALRS